MADDAQGAKGETRGAGLGRVARARRISYYAENNIDGLSALRPGA